MCEFIFDGDEWLEQKTNEDYTEVERVNFPLRENFRWECPFDAHHDEDYCIFHLKPDTRDKLSISDKDVRDQLVDAIRDDDSSNEFIGAHFGNVVITDQSLVPDLNRKISFEHATFHGDVVIESCIVPDCTFSWSKFHGSVSFKDSQFLDRCILFAADFHDMVFLSADFDGYVNLSAATFYDKLVSQGNFSGLVTCRETELKDELSLYGSEIEDLSIYDMAHSKPANITYTEIGDLSISLSAENEDSPGIDLSHSSIDEGSINVKSDEYMGIDLQGATLGNVNIDHPFNQINFQNTTFDGFDFSNHRSRLEEVSWELHQFHGQLFDHWCDDFSAIETTYLKARNGAAQSGDNKSASNFFIYEMFYRRKKLVDEFDSKWSLIKDRRSLTDYLSNLTMEKISAYGERPIRVLSVSTFTIVLFGLLYPLLGGLQTEDGEISLNASDSILQSVDMIIEGLYFSLITFTTVGYGDIQPASQVIRFLAGVESLLGALMMALLVFVLGRSVKW